MKEIDTEDTFFKEIMSKSELDVPFADFEDNVMGLIEKRHSKKVSIYERYKAFMDIFYPWIHFWNNCNHNTFKINDVHWGYCNG